MEKRKAKPMSKPNLEVLLRLIKGKPILSTKATNASNNRLKEEAWQDIASEFSAIVGETRRPDQLRLKWDNMKKAARKRTAAIRQNNLKTGGGKSFTPPDDILHRVSSMLGATCTEFTVKFGGDAADAADVSESSMLPSLTSLHPESQSDDCLADALLKAQVVKETALAGYYRAKAEMIKTETEKIKLEIEILKKNS